MNSELDVARGFALAAVLAADRGAERARPGLSTARRALLRETETLAALPKAEREEAVQTLIAIHVGQPTTMPTQALEPEDAPCVRQAMALLVASNPRADARARAAASRALRAGYFADRKLLLQLERIHGAERR